MDILWLLFKQLGLQQKDTAALIGVSVLIFKLSVIHITP